MLLSEVTYRYKPKCACFFFVFFGENPRRQKGPSVTDGKTLSCPSFPGTLMPGMNVGPSGLCCQQAWEKFTTGPAHSHTSRLPFAVIPLGVLAHRGILFDKQETNTGVLKHRCIGGSAARSGVGFLLFLYFSCMRWSETKRDK